MRGTLAGILRQCLTAHPKMNLTELSHNRKLINSLGPLRILEAGQKMHGSFFLFSPNQSCMCRWSATANSPTMTSIACTPGMEGWDGNERRSYLTWTLKTCNFTRCNQTVRVYELYHVSWYIIINCSVKGKGRGTENTDMREKDWS